VEFALSERDQLRSMSHARCSAENCEVPSGFESREPGDRVRRGVEHFKPTASNRFEALERFVAFVLDHRIARFALTLEAAEQALCERASAFRKNPSPHPLLNIEQALESIS
jgi:hypothetical protein